MDTETAILSSALTLAALVFSYARGVKNGRALLQPQIDQKDQQVAVMRAELDKIQKDMAAPATPFDPPVRTGEAFKWCGVRMVCTGNALQTVAGLLECVRAEYADRDQVVRTHTFAGSELDALRAEMARLRDSQSRSIFGEFPFPIHQEEQPT